MIGDFKAGRVGLVIWISLVPILIEPAKIPAQPSPGQDRPEGTQPKPTPPKPREFPPNASRVTANVLKYSVWPPGSLEGKKPLVPPDQTLYSFRLEILTMIAVDRPELGSYSPPGMVFEAFSAEPLAPDLVGKKIEARVRLTGDTEGVRWFISNVRVF